MVKSKAPIAVPLSQVNEQSSLSQRFGPFLIQATISTAHHCQGSQPLMFLVSLTLLLIMTTVPLRPYIRKTQNIL
jgi:hypothetical protein